MARVETIVVGGGVAGVAPFTLNAIPYVVATDPPGISATDFLSVVPTGANRGVIISTTGDPLLGTNRLRVRGGVVSEHASYPSSVVIGQNHTVSGAFANGFIFFGRDIALTSTGGANPIENVIIGADVTVNATGSNANANVHIGSNLSATHGTISGSIVISPGATHTGTAPVDVAIGNTTLHGGGGGNIYIGSGAGTSGTSANLVCIGVGATSASASSVVIGPNSPSNGSSGVQSVVIGNQASNLAQASIVIGSGSSVGNTAHTNNLILGAGLTSFAANTVQIGTSTFSQVSATFVLGGNDTDANAPATYSVRFTNQSGSNKAAPNVQVTGGRGTGTGAVGNIQFITSVAAASGVTQHTTQERMRLDGTTTAGQTAMLLWDVDNATLERVTVGAADSGGVGFKLLRIPN